MPRRCLIRDAVLAALLLGALLIDAAYNDKPHDTTALGVLAAVFAASPVVWRTRAPLLAVLVATAGAFAALSTLCPVNTIALPAMVIGYTIATTGDRRRTAFTAAGMAVSVAIAMAVYSPHGILEVDTVKNLGLVLLPLVFGAGVRDRRLYLAALHERLERAERTREEEARRRVGEERLRIAREVHDVVAHAMVAINVQAGVAAHLLRAGGRPDAATGALTEIKRVSGDALADLRATLGVLREEDAPAPVRPAQGLAALEELADRVRAAGVEVELEIVEGTRAVPSAVGAAAHRIVQEALTNVLRHAEAAHVTVRVEVRDRAVAIEVADDGAGATARVPAATGSGNGVRGMRERAEAVGGELEAGAGPGGGWLVRARLPLPG